MDEFNELKDDLKKISERMHEVCSVLIETRAETNGRLESIDCHLDRLNSRTDKNTKSIDILTEWKITQITKQAHAKERKETKIAFISLVIVNVINLILHFIP